MRKLSAATILFLIALCGIALFISTPSKAEPTKPWELEYQVVDFGTQIVHVDAVELQDRLNKLGKGGWDLTRIEGARAIFKRSK